ncbi:MAG: hypothetical protein IAF02_03725 [Anaerolineae bacterium]|nr:hypothetical protein [Anaerolineae bacterium]
MAPLEPWEKAFVNVVDFANEDSHGDLTCRDCHDGSAGDTKEEAHEGMISRPSEGEAKTCTTCHKEQGNAHAGNLHVTLEGYWTVLEARGADRENPHLQEAFSNHCSSCHTSCGDCHVAQPASVGGGLLDGHMFTTNPPMTRTCTACHGSRVGNEYMGKNEGVIADLHFRQERMTCIQCHPGTELHGINEAEPDAAPDTHRYTSDNGGPQCENCHEEAATGVDEVTMHMVHDENTLACQVCHSTTYINCDSCHVQVAEESGNPYFTTEESYFTFLIGKNPLLSEERPWKYVPLRHVPIDPNSFAFYGSNLLPNFDALPTWHAATPHNIQLETPQTMDCNHCHGNDEVFLTADKVKPEELTANQGVIVDVVPRER